jgi:uncharacterized protein (UPF0333 family)
VAVHPDDGQAAVELAALLPLIAVVLLVAWQFVVAGEARSSAAVAARSAARAAAVGADPVAAARSRLPVRLRRGLRVREGAGGSVTVSVRVPALAAELDLGRVDAKASLGASE